MERLLRTNEVARLCQVSQGTVIRWIHEGKLSASLTAGGHNRIRQADLVELLRTLRLPIPSELSMKEQELKVLIVDDEPEIRNIIRWMILQNITTARIEEAEEGFIAGWKTHCLRPDLVMLDLMLPGLDGFQVCEFIRRFPELKSTKIIAMSAFSDPEMEKRILGLGADDFLIKPFDLETLRLKICEAVEWTNGINRTK